MVRFHIGSSLVILASAIALAQQSTTTDLMGDWTVKWVEPVGGKPNKIVLDSGTILSGTYMADSREECPVTGIHATQTDGKVTLHVRCSKFNIDMEGSLLHSKTQPDNEIDGTYTYHYATGVGNGKFEMDRTTR
jgi:hypothetical protein